MVLQKNSKKTPQKNQPDFDPWAHSFFEFLIEISKSSICDDF
jgi:hypothetical protein